MRKIISILCILVIIFGSMNVCAMPEKSIDIVGNYQIVTISGTIDSQKNNEPVMLYIAKPGEELNSAEFIHIDQGLSGKGGNYSFTFTLNPYYGNGISRFLVKTNDGYEQVSDFEVYDMIAKAAARDGVNNALSVNDVKAALEGKKLSLGIEDIYDKVDKDFIYKNIYDEISKGTRFNDIKSLDDKIRELSVVSALNQGVVGIEKDGELVYLQYIGIDDESYNRYREELSSGGKLNVNSNMKGQRFANAGEAALEFKKLLYTNLITNYFGIGTSQVQDIIETKGELIGLDVEKYNQLAEKDKEDFHKRLVNSRAATPEELVEVYNTVLKEYLKDTSSGGGGGSSDGKKGTSGSSGSASVFIPIIKTEEALAQETQFVDLQGYEWAKVAIATLERYKIVNGVSENSFAPGKNVTREEFVKMLMSALNLVDASSISLTFSDVHAGDWYYEYIKSAVDKKIVNGISQEHFGVGQEITRQDMLTMAYKAMRYTSIHIDTDINAVSFVDQHEIADYASTAVKVFKKMSIVNGYPDGTFKPYNSTTRAEAAQIIYNLLKLKGDIQ